MRALSISAICIAIFAAALFLNASTQRETVNINIQIRDANTKQSLPGLIRLTKIGDSQATKLPGCYDRLKGLERSAPEKGWYVVPREGVKTVLPAGKYTLEAFSGLRSTMVKKQFDLTKQPNGPVLLQVASIFDPHRQNLQAGNTHLHLRNMTLKQAEEYLRAIPPADRLDVLFISHLERHEDDQTYITNKFRTGNLTQFNMTGVLVNNGEEHRHNFKAYGQGYGHVMLLDIKKLVQPVSIGPGIMAAGFDDPPLRTGIDNAKKQGGTVIWCHNTFGYEGVLNALTGRLDALNVFDGSRNDTYEGKYYRYLNVGLRMPISTGTDWFMYDFSRVYAEVPEKLTIKSWLNAVKKGRCQATNGPLLTLEVNRKKIGATLSLNEPETVHIEGAGIGRHDFSRLQLIHNGRVIKTQEATRDVGHFAARFTHHLRVDESGWLALRIDSMTKNELGKQLYAHTSPIYLQYKGKRRFDVIDAKELLRQIEEGKAAIQANAKFSRKEAGQQVIGMYDEGIRQLTKRINRK